MKKYVKPSIRIRVINEAEAILAASDVPYSEKTGDTDASFGAKHSLFVPASDSRSIQWEEEEE